jgi:replicative DNA helicase
LAQAEERIWSIREQRSPSQAHKLEDLAPVEVQRLERIYETRSAVLGIPSGFADLDALTAGWQPGDLILLAARPSMGKTACALNMAFHAAQKGTPTLFISLEQPKEQLTQRQIAASGGVNAWRLRSGKLRVDDWPMVIEGAAQTYGIPLWIVDAPAMTLLDIRSQARRLKRKEGAGLILVDYLQLIKDPRARSREQEVGNISRGLKALAKELCIPVIALAQLNREVEKRPNKRPQLSDLRESGSLEQDADLVIFLYRDEVYNENSPDKGLAEVNIAKQRNGPTGWIKLVYRKEVMQFADYQEGNFK